MRSWWRSHSVRMRLTLWYVGAMIVVLAVYAVAILAFVGRSVSHALDDRLRGDLYWVAATIDLEPDGTLTGPPEDPARLDEDMPWVQVWSAGGGDLLYANPEAQFRPLDESQALAASAEDRIVTVQATPVPMRVLSRRVRLYDRRPVVVQVGRSEAQMRAALHELRLILLFGLPVAVGVAGLGGYVLARRALAPVEQMTERARTITAERLSDRLPVQNPADEMGRLATVFNDTLARLQASFEQMRRFTADVSHELRTPLTAIRSVGEVGLIGHRDEAAYRSIIGSMLEEVDRLASLVDRLLTLSRAETGQAPLARDVVNLQALADEVVSHLSVLAEEKRQSLVVEHGGESATIGDRLVLRQALINLVDNAIKFSPAGGRIVVRLAAERGEAIVDVVDSGCGVPADLRTRIFDRFYRVSGTGIAGTGLGLSIAKGAVEASGGRLSLEQTGPRGSTFRITLPLARQERRRAG